MANMEHFEILKRGAEYWNTWRKENKLISPDLSGINLSGADLSECNLSKANLSSANLCDAYFLEANLYKANLSSADLKNARFVGAELYETNLSGANLTDADLSNANLEEANLTGAELINSDLSNAKLTGADFTKANLTGANLSLAICVETIFTDAKIEGARVYGVSAWNIMNEGLNQQNLIITKPDESEITVDNLEVAQFIYLLLNNAKIREVIDTITSKMVLILGRFTSERIIILDSIKKELRKRDYLPVLFDFKKSSSRDITETISTLAHMARFVIADITDARSIPQELMLIVPNLPSVPIKPILLCSQNEYGMFEHFKRFPWVLETHLYSDTDKLIASFSEDVIGEAEKKVIELREMV
jgi:hypothetical protein